MKGGFHSFAVLRESLGEEVLFLPAGHLPRRATGLRGAIGRLAGVARTRGMVEFGRDGRWEVPLAALLLRSDPRAEGLRAEALARRRLEMTARPRRTLPRGFRRRRPSGRPRDAQRSRLYRFEDAVLPRGRAGLTLAECRGLVARVLAPHGLAPPRITDGRGRRSAAYLPARGAIALPRAFRDERTVVHEAAHVVAAARAPGEPPHGPTFVSVFLELAARWLPDSPADLPDRARTVGLRLSER